MWASYFDHYNLLMLQAWLSVPDVIETLMNMAKNGQDGVALCYIPTSKPYYPYPDYGPHLFVLPADHDVAASPGYGMPADFSAFEAISYTFGTLTAVSLTSELQFGPEHSTSKGLFALGDNDMESLCHQITFLSSSANSYIGNHATHFLVIRNGCCTYS